MRSGARRWLGWTVWSVAGFVGCQSQIGPDTSAYEDASAEARKPSDASLRDGHMPADSSTPTDSGSVTDSTTPPSDSGRPRKDSGGHLEDGPSDADKRKEHDHHVGTGGDADLGDTGPGNDGPVCNLLRPAVQYSTPASQPSWIIAADLNADGNADLAMNAGVSVLLGRGDGTFGTAASYGAAGRGLAAADLRSNGKQDLVVADSGDPSNGLPGGATVLLGKGDGTFGTAITYPAGACPYGIGVADFNGDGKPDLAAASDGFGCYGYGSGGVYVLLGAGDGTFGSPVKVTTGSTPGQLATADLNADHKADIVFGDVSGLTVLLGNGDGTFKAPTTYGPPSIDVLIADLNLDGKLDLAGGDEVFLGVGDGTFGPAITTPAGGFMDVGDVNHDGKPDLVTITGVCLGNGDGSFEAPIAFTSGTNPFSVAVKDYDNDGRVDVAVANDGSGNVSVLLSCQ